MKNSEHVHDVKGRLRAHFSPAFVALFLCWAFTASATQAQGLREVQPTEPAESVVSVPVTSIVALEALSSMDLTNMSRAWWRAVRKDHIRLLGSSDDALKEQALQNLIVFAKTYRKQVDLTKAVPKLYKLYQRDENESHRIMALSALGNIGNRNIMALLREDVKQEKSERVRRHTLYLLADYYKNQTGQ